MNFPDDSNEVKTDRKRQIEIISGAAILGSFFGGIIITVVAAAIDEPYFVLFGLYITGAPFGINHFFEQNRNGKSKVGSKILVGIITLIGIGLVYGYMVTNLF